MELLEKKERAERQLAALNQREELSGDLAQAVALLEADLESLVKALPNEAMSKLCKLIFRKVSVEAQGPNHQRDCWVQRYEFTPDFSDLIAHSTRMVELRKLFHTCFAHHPQIRPLEYFRLSHHS